jgi:hypothetical protein
LQLERTTPPPSFWTNWLLATSIGVMLFGLTLVLAPELSRSGFSLLIYADPHRITSFEQEAVRYISLAHAVLGGVMFGWGVALAIVIRTLFAAGYRLGWTIVAFSVAAWFVPDTVYSLASGYWQNAVLNFVFFLLFAAPLVATRQHFRGGKA